MSFAEIGEDKPISGELQPAFFVERVGARVRDSAAAFGMRAEVVWIVHGIPKSPGRPTGNGEKGSSR